MNDVIIGIDLGTTNSEVAVTANGITEVIASDGKQLFPSFVGLADDGAILVGESAKNQYALYPERTIKSIKRKMGTNDDIQLGKQHYTPQEISAIILKNLKMVAEKHLGHAVAKAVITVPAYFSDVQRLATREAGEIAGLDVVRIINEPTAAALAYEAGHKGHKRVLVYDLGGGTFDVSVVGIEDGVVEVLASHGNNHLGGDDFDKKIVDHIIAHLQQTHNIDISDSQKAIARIDRLAETAKIGLSDQPYVTLEEEYLAENNGNPVHLSLELSRNDYEAMILPFIDETLEAVHIALNSAQLTVSDLDEILLVGGATRTPLVAARIQHEIRLEPSLKINPDLCVVTGAAMQAAMIAGDKVGSVLVDITPYTFGTSALADFNGEQYPYCFIPIIKKNTPIPITKAEGFYTAYDGQEKVEVSIYQGEDPDALNNIEIGKFLIEGLRNVPQGNKIITTFSLDLNGLLHVSTKEKDTGLEKNLIIENAISRFEQAELDVARDRINTLFTDENQFSGNIIDGEAEPVLEEQRLVTQARALIEKAERQLQEISDDDKEDMIDMIEKVNDALAANEHQLLTDAMEELTDLLFYLEG